MHIGFFDSGSGGLSVLRAFTALAPGADIIYFGDTANAPYGTRDAAALEALAQNGISFLKGAGATHILAACNSVSPSILSLDAGDTPMIEMSLPTARALSARAHERFLLLATPATIASRLYERATSDMLTLDPLPISELAGAIERGDSRDTIRRIVREALTLRVGKVYDTIILGCTHYPLVRDIIEDEAETIFGDLKIVDPAEAVASEAVARFGTDGSGSLTFYLSRASRPFETRVAELFPNRPYTMAVVENAFIV